MRCNHGLDLQKLAADAGGPNTQQGQALPQKADLCSASSDLVSLNRPQGKTRDFGAAQKKDSRIGGVRGRSRVAVLTDEAKGDLRAFYAGTKAGERLSGFPRGRGCVLGVADWWRTVCNLKC